MMSVASAGGRRNCAVPPVSVPAESRAIPVRVLVAVLVRLCRAGSVSVLLGATALVWMLGTLLSSTHATTNSSTATQGLASPSVAVRTVANVAGGPSGGSGGGSAAPKPAAAKSSSDSGSSSGGSSAPKPAASSNSPSSGSGGAGGSSADSNTAPKPAPKPAPPAPSAAPAQGSAGSPGAKPAPQASPAADASATAAVLKPAQPAAANATPPGTGVPKPATPATNVVATPPTGAPKPPDELEPTTGTAAVAHKPGQPDQTGPSLSPVLNRNNPSTLLESADPMAALAGKYRAPGPANQGGSISCGAGGCPAPLPAVPAPAGPVGPTNVGDGTGAASVAGGSGPARLAGSNELTNPDGTPPAGGAPARSLLDPTQSPGGARGPPPNNDPLAGVPGVPQLAGPGQGGLSPWAQAYNDSPVGKAITRTIAPGSMIPGVIGQVNKNFAQGPIDGLANAGYEGTAVALHPGTAAQDSTGRWSSALDGHPGQLFNDYWQHPGQSLAEDTQTLTQAHPNLTRALTTAAQGTPMGSAATILSNPVGAAYVGDTAGGLAHLGYTETQRWGPALAAVAPGGAVGMAAAGIDPLANVKADYNRDAAGALTEDLATVGMVAGAAAGAGAGAAEAGTMEASTAARAGMAETGTAAPAGAETGGLASRAAGPMSGEAPAAATGPGRIIDRPNANPSAQPTRPAQRPSAGAGTRPTGPAGTRPGGRTLGPRGSGGSDEMATVGGGNKPLTDSSTGQRPGTRVSGTGTRAPHAEQDGPGVGGFRDDTGGVPPRWADARSEHESGELPGPGDRDVQPSETVGSQEPDNASALPGPADRPTTAPAASSADADPADVGPAPTAKPGTTGTDPAAIGPAPTAKPGPTPADAGAVGPAPTAKPGLGSRAAAAARGLVRATKEAWIRANVRMRSTSTPDNGSVFWSGWQEGNMDEAQAYARNNSGKTVEMTQAGKWLDSTWPYNKLQKAVGPDTAKDIWDKVSTRFAWGASGEVNAFIRGMRGTPDFLDKTYMAIEKKILDRNPNVTKITEHE